MIQVISALAVALNFIGVVIMVRYGLPNRLPLLGSTSPDLTDTDKAEVERRDFLGILGVVLFALGSGIQIVSIYLLG